MGRSSGRDRVFRMFQMFIIGPALGDLVCFWILHVTPQQQPKKEKKYRSLLELLACTSDASVNCRAGRMIARAW